MYKTLFLLPFLFATARAQSPTCPSYSITFTPQDTTETACIGGSNTVPPLRVTRRRRRNRVFMSVGDTPVSPMPIAVEKWLRAGLSNDVDNARLIMLFLDRARAQVFDAAPYLIPQLDTTSTGNE